MFKLLSYVKPYWKTALLAPLLMALEVTMDLLQPRLVQRIIDVGIGEMKMDVVFTTGGLMIGAAFVGVVGGVGCSVFAIATSRNAGADLRGRLFEKIQQLSFGNLDEMESGNLITVLTSDVNIYQRAVAMGLRILVRGPLLMIGSLTMALITAPGLSWIILVALPLVIFLLLFLNRKVAPLFRTVQEKLDKVNTVMRENLSGIRVIKSFVRSDYEIDRFGEANRDYMAINRKARRIMGVVMPLVGLILNMGIVAVIWFGGRGVVAGGYRLGQIVAFYNYLLRLLGSLTMIGMILINLSRAVASAERMAGILEKEPDLEEAIEEGSKDDPQVKGQIEFQDVSFSYRGDGGKPVLEGIDLTVRAGETVGIVGPTGSGKSSLVYLIPRLYDPTAGRVLVDGKDVRKISKKALRGGIGFVMQETILFARTVRENIRFGKPAASEEEVRQAAQIAQAHQFIKELPAGYDTSLGQRGINLSGGQKQRLAIARALLINPDILILDDSASAVDMKTESQLMKAIKAVERDSTTVIIAQKISTVKDAERIVVLEDGRVAGQGNHSQLLRDNEIYREIYASQRGGEGDNDE